MPVLIVKKKTIKCVACQLDLIENNDSKQHTYVNIENIFDKLSEESRLAASKLFTNLKRTPYEIICVIQKMSQACWPVVFLIC
jgi:hypothetical protein